MELKPTDPTFARVWDRVQGKSAPDPVPPEEPAEPDWAGILERALVSEQARCQLYIGWGLEEGCRECRKRIRKLAAARFFRTGARQLPGISRPLRVSCGGWETLRALYLEETQWEQDYLRFRDDCRDPVLAQVFDFCACRCRAGMESLWARAEGG